MRLGVERRELDPFDPAGPLELGEEGQQRVAPVELVGAIGADEHDRHVAQVADEEAEQVARRRSDQWRSSTMNSDGASAGESLEHAEQQLEQPALRRADAQPGRGAASRR